MDAASNIVYQGGQGEIVEKKSRFIASIFPVKTEEEALAKITETRKKYYDARHNCFAYIIGRKRETERCSDDGEPSGTAGRPMLDVLTGMGLHDVAAVVTRYFGGTLLGTGGLVRAYSAAMKEGLANCKILSEKTGFRLRIATDYNEVGKLQHLARTQKLHELACDYADSVTMELLVPEDEIGQVEREVAERTFGRAVFERVEKLSYGICGSEVILL